MSIQSLPSPALLTDLYQLTMACGYWKVGLRDHRAVFHLFFRSCPFDGGYAIAAGLDTATRLIERWRFSDEDTDYLATLTGNDGAPLFNSEFLRYLRETPFSCDVDAMPEGTVAFPHQPLLRIRGPLIQCQLLETALLTIINFQTLIATKASRIVRAAGDGAVLEFGLRRAQGIDGGLSASRAAYIGGCAATSNVLAGKLYGVPVRGTHAHSWVMAFDSEREAFEKYAAAMPNNCIFLVDTYDTVQGVHTAVEVARALRQQGHELVGVRLDSGDLAALSIKARRILDEAGFPDAAVVASDSLDEDRITELRSQGAQIRIWGVGTHLATARDQPALGGVYKLAAIAAPGQPWSYRVKLSENPIKVSNPGEQQIQRYTSDDGLFSGDVIFNESTPPPPNPTSISVHDASPLPAPQGTAEDLLVPLFRAGVLVGDRPDV
ncbi:MAG: nicotinate phosphoribosyltransferase, partial [Myxococcota bacterium]